MDPHQRCSEHTLNLASQKSPEGEQGVRACGKNEVVGHFFHKSPKATEVLREIQTQLHLLFHLFPQDEIAI